MSNPIAKLTSLGQSLWYDNIERRLIENGELAAMIARGDIRGLTSNPSIFYHAISQEKDYDSALIPLSWSGYSASKIFEQVAIEDIRDAADMMLPLYKRTSAGDGYVSLEVNPDLAYDTERSLAEAQRLWDLVQRPNVMIKIPATQAGLPAIRQSIAAGININITLIFSIRRYLEVMDAYLSGLEDRLASGKPIDQIASVASFFVSRIDTKADKYLDVVLQKGRIDGQKAQALLGKMAIANAKLAYQEFRTVFEGERFERLKARGANLQRPLWASTSTKNPAYPDTLYVEELIGRHTVNTVPPKTLDAFRDHGQANLAIEEGLGEARQAFIDAEAIGISMDTITQELEEEGVKAFSESYVAILTAIEEYIRTSVGQLGTLAANIPERVAELHKQAVVKRLHEGDPSLWTQDPQGQAEVSIRLGWLNLPESSRLILSDLSKFIDEVRQAGYTNILVLGMGGSSLAPQVMSLMFGDQTDGLRLRILDSTHPASVLAATRWSKVKQTLYIVSSKSGGTAEINAFLAYFWQRAQHAVGKKAPEHFVAITDPGTSLESLARERGFRRVFLADPHVGGRYSVLTAFGLVPAALLGIDLERLLRSAAWMARQCDADLPEGRNPGLVLGAILGEAARTGRNKLTLVAEPQSAPFGAWLEQLIAESSGKQGKGIIPVNDEPLAVPDIYGNDRLFIYLKTDGRHAHAVDALQKAGQPVLTMDVADPYALGAEFYRWEVATAVACAILGVNAFDQPDVQDSKTRTKEKITIYQKKGNFSEGQPAWEGQGVKIYGQLTPGHQNIRHALITFLAQGKIGDYVALNAFLPRTVQNEALLRHLRVIIQKQTGFATTVGFGPRFLHSTGQLHKGGANDGIFFLFTEDARVDVDIPGQGLPFSALIRGQALGDLEALQARGRRVLRIHLTKPDAIRTLIEAL